MEVDLIAHSHMLRGPPKRSAKQNRHRDWGLAPDEIGLPDFDRVGEG